MPHPSARSRRSPERGIGKLLPATRPIPAVWRGRLHGPRGRVGHNAGLARCCNQGAHTAHRGVNAPNHSLHSPFVRASVLISTSASFGCSDTPVDQRLRPHGSTLLYRLTSRQILPTHALVLPTHALVLPTHALVLPTRALVRPTHALVLPTRALVLPTRALVRPTHALVRPTHALVLPTRALVRLTRGRILPTRGQILPIFGLFRRSPAQNRRFPDHSAPFPPFFMNLGPRTRHSPPQAQEASLAEPAGVSPSHSV